MSRRLVLLGSLLVLLGAGFWLVLNHYISRPETLPAFTEKQLGISSNQVLPSSLVSNSRSSTVQLAIGGLGLPDSANDSALDLLTVDLSRVDGLALVDRKN